VRQGSGSTSFTYGAVLRSASSGVNRRPAEKRTGEDRIGPPKTPRNRKTLAAILDLARALLDEEGAAGPAMVEVARRTDKAAAAHQVTTRELLDGKAYPHGPMSEHHCPFCEVEFGPCACDASSLSGDAERMCLTPAGGKHI